MDLLLAFTPLGTRLAVFNGLSVACLAAWGQLGAASGEQIPELKVKCAQRTSVLRVNKGVAQTIYKLHHILQQLFAKKNTNVIKCVIEGGGQPHLRRGGFSHVTTLWWECDGKQLCSLEGDQRHSSTHLPVFKETNFSKEAFKCLLSEKTKQTESLMCFHFLDQLSQSLQPALRSTRGTTRVCGTVWQHSPSILRFMGSDDG